MDGWVPDAMYLEERRRRLAAERTLVHTRGELVRAHSALVANADRLSRSYLSEREHNLSLTERQAAVLAQRKEAADRADRARRRLWHALEAMRDGFALFDGSGRLIAANHVYLDLFDAASEIAPGVHATEIFARAAEEGAFDIGNLTPEQWAQAQVERWDAETIAPLVLQRYDGRVLRLQDRRAPDGDVVSLALDITDDHDRAAALAAARDAAEQMARAKADFLARMSHEIRTPMNGVLGMAQMLAEQAGDAETALYARTIQDSAEALLVIVNDTLDASALEAGKVELREASFDLEGMLCDCSRLAAAIAQPGVVTGLFYPIGARTRFLGDEGRIRQIVTNLLGNALKFTDAGHVVLRAEVGAACVTITVEDTGTGIPVALQVTVFEAFGQVDDPAHPAREGTGLGLTISRGLAERMGGTLTLESTLGQGSIFALTLPLASDGVPAPLPPLPRAVAVPPGGGLRSDLVAERLRRLGLVPDCDITPDTALVLLPLSVPADVQIDLLARIGPATRLVVLGRKAEAAPGVAARADAVLAVPVAGACLLAALTGDADAGTARILLADDNATNRLLLDRMLADRPFDCEMVCDGAQAVEAYRRQRPDAVVLDISMPLVDGFGAAAAIRAMEAERGGTPAPLIALTANVGGDMAERLRTAGFAAHLTKPVKRDVLLGALASALQVSRTS